jgi:hypothetical protein
MQFKFHPSACLKFISGFQPQSGEIGITAGETRGINM